MRRSLLTCCLVLALAPSASAAAGSGGALAPADGPVPTATGGLVAGAAGAPPATASQAGAAAWGDHLPLPAPAPATPAPVVPATGPVAPTATPYGDLITATARRYGLAPTLLTALVWKESSFNPKAKSPAGARGLTQLMPGTAKELGVKRVYDPVQNLDGGARYLKAQIDRFGRVDFGLAAYNAGAGNVIKHKGIPPFKETRRYVRDILAYELQLRARR